MNVVSESKVLVPYAPMIFSPKEKHEANPLNLQEEITMILSEGGVINATIEVQQIMIRIKAYGGGMNTGKKFMEWIFDRQRRGDILRSADYVLESHPVNHVYGYLFKYQFDIVVSPPKQV